MNDKDTGGNAFPHPHSLVRSGMTLRDYFAAQVIAAFVAHEYVHDNSEVLADKAYTIADAMLEMRK